MLLGMSSLHQYPATNELQASVVPASLSFAQLAGSSWILIALTDYSTTGEMSCNTVTPFGCDADSSLFSCGPLWFRVPRRGTPCTLCSFNGVSHLRDCCPSRELRVPGPRCLQPTLCAAGIIRPHFMGTKNSAEVKLRSDTNSKPACYGIRDISQVADLRPHLE